MYNIFKPSLRVLLAEWARACEGNI
jgi:hypothetical protein